MNNEKIILIGLGLLIGGVVMWAVMSGSNASFNSGMMRGQAQNMMRSDNIDAHFIEQMIPHHEDAVTMAKLALTRSQKPEIKKLAQDIITSQTQEIDQMKSWYKDWFGKDVPLDLQVMGQHGMMGGSDMHMGMMGDGSDMIKLEQAVDFDKVFIEEMIPHHQMAVMMAQMLKGGTTRVEMEKLAVDIITAQTREIEQMRGWYKDWGY